LWVQEIDGGPNSGIWVYTGENSPDLASLEVGDLVDVLGVSGTFNEVYEINVLNGHVVSSDKLDSLPPPNLLTLAELDGSWESVLVRVDGSVKVVGLPGAGEFVITDGQAEAYVDDYV